MNSYKDIFALGLSLELFFVDFMTLLTYEKISILDVAQISNSSQTLCRPRKTFAVAPCPRMSDNSQR